MSEIEEKTSEKFVIQLVLSKLEPDGETISSFRLLDHEEIVSFSILEKTLKKYYNTGLEKIKEIAEELQNLRKI